MPPIEPLAGNLYKAIWTDIAASTMLHNGDALAAEWYEAGSKDPEAIDHHIRNLRCRGGPKPYRCDFRLLRDDPAPESGSAPIGLSCWALFERSRRGGGWIVRHPPPGDGWVHSQSTMRCRRV